MASEMFCFQCEQTAGCVGCKGKAGMYGKTVDVAKLQDQQTGALIELARATDGSTCPSTNTYRLIIKGLFTTITNVNFNAELPTPSTRACWDMPTIPSTFSSARRCSPSARNGA